MAVLIDTISYCLCAVIWKVFKRSSNSFCAVEILTAGAGLIFIKIFEGAYASQTGFLYL